jgi:FtsZ-interacting cell division protein ZipA
LQTHISLAEDLLASAAAAAAAAVAAADAAQPNRCHKHADMSNLGHIKGLEPSVKVSDRLLKPTVSSRIKQKGSEGHQLSKKQAVQQPTQPKAGRRSGKPAQQQQQLQHKQSPAVAISTVQQQAQLSVQGTQYQQPQKAPGDSGTAVVPPGMSSTAGPSGSGAVLYLDKSATGSATGKGTAGASQQSSSLSAVKRRLGLTAGLQVAEVSFHQKLLRSL